MPKITYESRELEIPKEALDELMEKYGKKAVWEPKPNERHYFINAHQEVDYFGWADDAEDRGRYDMGNCFKTKEEAEVCLESGWIAQRLAQVRIERFIIENGLDFEPDWMDGICAKYYPYYGHDSNEFLVTSSNYCQINPSFHFKSQNATQKVIDNCEADLKILFGIK